MINEILSWKNKLYRLMIRRLARLSHVETSPTLEGLKPIQKHKTPALKEVAVA